MLGRFLWADGCLELLPVSKTTYRQMLAQLSSQPSNFVGGDFSVSDHGYEFDKVKLIWSKGEFPMADDLRYMIRNELDRYGRELRAEERILTLAVTTEDTEPTGGEGFLKDPHKNLYPYLFPDGGTDMPEKVRHLLKSHVLNQLEEAFEDPDNFIYFTCYGSGLSYNWDEGGDLDIQMWVDIEKFQQLNEEKATWTMDDLLAEVRRNVQLVNFPTVKEIGLVLPNGYNDDVTPSGDMLIQYYPKPGKGTEEENLAQKPYACLDLESNKWIVKPKPFDPEFYGLHFLEVMPKATDMAIQAEALLDEFERNVLNWQFWFSLYSRYRNPAYQEQYQEAQRNAIMEHEGIQNMFKGIFGGRQEAYTPEGKGIEDERDMTQKLLEVWGIFQRLKHYARAPLPWDEQDLPAPPQEVGEDNSKSDSEKQNRDSRNDSKNFTVSHGWTIAHRLEPWEAKWPVVELEDGTMYMGRPGDTHYELAFGEPHTQYDVIVEPETGKVVSFPRGLGGLKTIQKQVDDYLSRRESANEYITPEVGQVYATTTKPFHWLEIVDIHEDGTVEIVQLPGGRRRGYFDPVRWERQVRRGEFIYRGYRRNDFVFESKWVLAGQYDSPEHRDPGGWQGIMEKAQRLRQQGQIQVQRNGVQNIVGQVQGDHGTYETEIWRSDPQRNTISLWNCSCPWGGYSWGRTRQFKKYEGRPCAHTLALYWEALSHPLDEEYGENQQLTIPGIDPYLDQSQQQGQPTVDLNNAVQQTIRPRTPQPSQIVQPSQAEQLNLTFPGTFSKWHKRGALQNGDYARIRKALIGVDDRGTQYTVPRNSIVEIIWSDDKETIAIYSLNSPALGPHNARIVSDTANFAWVPRTRGTEPKRRR